MGASPLLTRLIQSLQILPGVGPKSAQRMALTILQRQREGAARLAEDLARAVEGIKECQWCRNLTEESLCGICADERRDRAVLCVVESPADIFAIEQAGGYSGQYFVLHGRLSPIDGIGPEELHMDRLLARVRRDETKEVIVATNATVEGEATAHYIQDLLGDHVESVSRLAQGMPVGGELEYADGGTILHALQGRRRLGAV